MKMGKGSVKRKLKSATVSFIIEDKSKNRTQEEFPGTKSNIYRNKVNL